MFLAPNHQNQPFFVIGCFQPKEYEQYLIRYSSHIHTNLLIHRPLYMLQIGSKDPDATEGA